MSMTKVRVLVVEDSVTVLRRLCEVVGADPGIEVVGRAQDGKRAIEMCAQLRPDVMSLDMMLPVMSGVAVTEYVMAHTPTPILIVSSSFNRGELFKTFDALAAGAVDVLEKPRGDEEEGVWEARYLASLKRVSRIKVITHPRYRLRELGNGSGNGSRPTMPESLVGENPWTPRVIALGASTGGPSALVEVIRMIPANLALPVLVVLHIERPFAGFFAEWLDGQTSHRVVYAEDGELTGAANGRVVMAPPGFHLVVREGRFRLLLEPERHSCRPSIDVLFESLAAEYGRTALACLLTGMGRDGASGLLDIKKAGGFTIAQDEATSVVYGMPREAALLGAARRVLPLSEIGASIADVVRGGRAW